MIQTFFIDARLLWQVRQCDLARGRRGSTVSLSLEDLLRRGQKSAGVHTARSDGKMLVVNVHAHH